MAGSCFDGTWPAHHDIKFTKSPAGRSHHQVAQRSHNRSRRRRGSAPLTTRQHAAASIAIYSPSAWYFVYDVVVVPCILRGRIGTRVFSVKDLLVMDSHLRDVSRKTCRRGNGHSTSRSLKIVLTLRPTTLLTTYFITPMHHGEDYACVSSATIISGAFSS